MKQETVEQQTMGQTNEQAVAKTGRCARCHRTLRDKVSVERGMGPVCAGKAGGGPGRIPKSKQVDGQLNIKPEPPEVFTFGKVGGEIKTNVPHWLDAKHSRDFAWGYGGSGPAELAANIIGMFLGAEKTLRHPAIYQDFKWKFIDTMPMAGGKITKKQVEDFLAESAKF